MPYNDVGEWYNACPDCGLWFQGEDSECPRCERAEYNPEVEEE